MESGVTGIGGVFLRARDPDRLRGWYHKHLGLPLEEGSLVLRSIGDPPMVLFALFEDDTEYFGPGRQAAMVNFRVDDLDRLLGRLRDAGVPSSDKVLEQSGVGRFGWAVDPEGNRFELWEPAPGV
jgi:predicted enzyme related to lactoylglutathione lyase